MLPAAAITAVQSTHRRRWCRRLGLSKVTATVLAAVALSTMSTFFRSTLPTRSSSTYAWSIPGFAKEQTSGRRAVLAGALMAPSAAWAEQKEVPPGYVPSGLVSTKVGEIVNTPNGLKYEMLEKGTSETGARNGPPRSGSTVWVRYTGHINGFDGPVFDSSKVRGMRRASKQDFVEIRLNLEGSITNGMFEALKLMKVGEKGRFEQPPLLSYKDGKVGFQGDDELEVKGTIEPGTTLYYDVELVRIIKP